MKAAIFVLLIFFSLSTFAQVQLKSQLLSYSYYLDNPPEYKVFGEQSDMLKQEYGAEFLSVGARYVQVYNYASYYLWFFQFYASEFSDLKDYQGYFDRRDKERMFRYIQSNKRKIEEILARQSLSKTGSN